MGSNLLTIRSLGFKTSSITVFFFLLIGVIQPTYGQITFDSKEELIEVANSFFVQGEYNKAKPLFSQLLSQDALNADYNYRFGVCILFTEDDPVKPMPYIEGGAGSPGVNNEAFYFLGKLYQLNYRFDEAIDAYSKAKSKGVLLQNVDIDKEIQACRSGKVLYSPDYDFNPVSVKTAIEKEFFRPYDFRKLKGKVIPMPPQFKTKFDQKKLSGSFVFTPMVGKTLFYASYGEDGANGKDIYRVRKLPNGEWALPVRLPDLINSNLDEDHAFFDTQNGVLYFSSQGHNSMGGSDIFQSAYNSTDDSWSPPLNLQYPFSSPFDDYFYVTDPDFSVAYFTSTRESEEGHVKVFRMALPNKEGNPVSVVTGQYREASDSTQTEMKAQLRQNNELIGVYRTNPNTGKYVIVAVPDQGYELSVAPRDKESFEFPINLPSHFKFKPLEQETKFNSAGESFNVELTNFFNGKGEEDSITVMQSKSSDELPGIVASVNNSASSETAIADAADKSNEDARSEIASLEREKAMLDSIAQAEALAAEEAKKSAEQAELAAQKEQSRLDSLAAAEQLAAEAELKRKQEESERLAHEKSEQAMLDSIAQAEALAAEEAKKSAEQAELAAQKEQSRLDSLAAAEQLAAEAELKRKQEESERLAHEKSEQAMLDSIAQAEALAAEEAKKSAEQAELAAQKEQSRLDSLAAAEQLAAEAELKRKQEESERLAHEKSEQAMLDSIAQAEALAVEEAKKSAEQAELAAQKEQSRLDSLAAAEQLAAEAELKRKQEESERLAHEKSEQAMLDSIAQAEALAAEEAKKSAEQAELAAQKEQSRLDSLAAAEQLAAEAELKRKQEESERLAHEKSEQAMLDSIAQAEALAAEEAKKSAEQAELAAQKEQSRLDSLAAAEQLAAEADEMSQQLAEDRAKEINATSDQEISEAKQLLDEEGGFTSKNEIQNAIGNADSENSIDPSKDLAEAESMASEIEGFSQLDSLNAELARLLVNLNSNEDANPETNLHVIEISEKIFAQEQIEDEKQAARILANLDERMEKSKQLSDAKAEEENRLKAEIENRRNEVERLISNANQAEDLVQKGEQTRLDSIAAEEQLALIEEQKLEHEELSSADAFLKAIEDAELEIPEDEKGIETSAIAEETIEEFPGTSHVEKTGDQFIDEVLGMTDENSVSKNKVESSLEVYEEPVLENTQAVVSVKVLAIEEQKADSVARELEMEMARAEAEAMELALKNETTANPTIEELVMLSDSTEPQGKHLDPKPVELLQEDVDDSELIAEKVSSLKKQLTKQTQESFTEIEIAKVEEETEQLLVEDSTNNDLVIVNSAQQNIKNNNQVIPEAKEAAKAQTFISEEQQISDQNKTIQELVLEAEVLLAESEFLIQEGEAESLAQQLEMLRRDSLASSELTAAEESKASVGIAELAQKKEEARLDSIALEEALAAEEAKKSAEQAELAAQKEQSRLDSIAAEEQLAAESDFEKLEGAKGELKAEKAKNNSRKKSEEIMAVEVDTAAYEEEIDRQLSEADAFMKAIEKAEKTKTEEFALEVPHLADTNLALITDHEIDVGQQEEEAKPALSNDDWLQKHKVLAAEKEKALNEKINADRAALGLKPKEELEATAEVEEETKQIEEKVVAQTSVDLVAEEKIELVEGSNLDKESSSVVQESVVESVGEDIAIEGNETLLEMPDAIDIAVAKSVEKPGFEEETPKVLSLSASEEMGEAISSGVTRLFFITPAMRDYTNRQVDFNSIQDRGKRRLIQRMLAEDRGRLAVLKNIHNSRIDYSSDQAALRKLRTNARNRDVLSGLEIAQARIDDTGEEEIKVNWFDRHVREGITYRLAFVFKPNPVSENIREAINSLIETNFEMVQTNISTGYHTKLANARAEFLEYRSRGYSNMEVQAFEQGGQIPLTEVMNRAVIEN